MSYKSDILLEITNNTERFLLSKNTSKILEGILETIGNVTNVDKLSFFENNKENNTYTQKYRWTAETKSLTPPNENLINLSHNVIPEISARLIKNEIYYSIVRKMKDTISRDFLLPLNKNQFCFYPFL